MIKRIIGSLIAGMVGLALFTVQIGAVILYAQYPRAAIDLQEPYVDNSYHNPKDVARVGDMLYVHYRKPKKLTVVNGVLEISRGGPA